MDQPGNHILLRGNSGGAADRMRELLARTVQDHVADQRSNAGALEDIRQRLEGLEWLVKEIREREVPGLAARLDGLPRNFEQAVQRPPAWAESLVGHIESLRTQVTPLSELHAMWPEVSTVVSTVAENVEQALPRLQAVCDTTGQALEALRAQDERMAGLQDSVGMLQQSMEAAAGRFNRLDKAVAELTHRTAQLDREMSAVKDRAEAGFGTLTDRLDQSAESVTGIGGQIEVLGGQVQVVHGRIERLDERLDDQYDRVSVIDKSLSSMDGRLGALQAKLGPVDSRLSAVDSRLAALDGKVGAVGSRLDGLDERLTGQEERLVAWFEPLAEEVRSRPRHAEVADAVAKVVDAAQGEVTAQIGSLEETVLTLAEALLRPQSHPAAAREGTRI